MPRPGKVTDQSPTNVILDQSAVDRLQATSGQKRYPFTSGGRTQSTFLPNQDTQSVMQEFLLQNKTPLTNTPKRDPLQGPPSRNVPMEKQRDEIPESVSQTTVYSYGGSCEEKKFVAKKHPNMGLHLAANFEYQDVRKGRPIPQTVVQSSERSMLSANSKALKQAFDPNQSSSGLGANFLGFEDEKLRVKKN